MLDYITKPVVPELLRGKVQAFAALYAADKGLRLRDAALAAKDRQIAMLARDPRNPLSTILTGLQFMLRTELPDRAKTSANASHARLRTWTR